MLSQKNNINEGITKSQQGHPVCRAGFVTTVVNKRALPVCWDTQVLKHPALHQLMFISEQIMSLKLELQN